MNTTEAVDAGLRCKLCRGHGVISERANAASFPHYIDVSCPECGGSGLGVVHRAAGDTASDFGVEVQTHDGTVRIFINNESVVLTPDNALAYATTIVNMAHQLQRKALANGAK